MATHTPMLPTRSQAALPTRSQAALPSPPGELAVLDKVTQTPRGTKRQNRFLRQWHTCTNSINCLRKKKYTKGYRNTIKIVMKKNKQKLSFPTELSAQFLGRICTLDLTLNCRSARTSRTLNVCNIDDVDALCLPT